MTDADTDVPVLDREVLDQLRESVGRDEEFVRELIAAYVGEAAPAIDAIADAADSGDAAAIVRPAHTLKSTSASIGALRLSAICRTIEDDGRNARSDGLGSRVAAARMAWHETLEALRSEGLAE